MMAILGFLGGVVFTVAGILVWGWLEHPQMDMTAEDLSGAVGHPVTTASGKEFVPGLGAVSSDGKTVVLTILASGGAGGVGGGGGGNSHDAYYDAIGTLYPSAKKVPWPTEGTPPL